MLADLAADLRFAARTLRRTPLFTVVAVASLALGIGGSAAVFALINAIVLRQLPVPDAQQLFVAERQSPTGSSQRFSWPSFERTRDRLAGRAEAFAVSSNAVMQMRLDTDEGSTGERGIVQLVSGEYFGSLRQRAQLGRLLTPDDNRRIGAHPVAVISDTYWRRRMAAAPDAIGRTVTINGTPFTIVGVTAPGFFGTLLATRGPDAWLPIMMQPAVHYAGNSSSHDNADTTKPWPPQETIEWLTIFTRVPSRADLGSMAAGITAQMHAEAEARLTDPDDRRRARAEQVALLPAARGVSRLRTAASSPLYVLLAMMGVLLVIACGNVAGLLVARGSARERELAIRASLGAGRFRLVRQLLVESLLLGLLGGAAGLGLAVWGRDLLLALLINGAGGAEIVTLDTHLDARVLGFALGVSLLTGVLCGLVPALRAGRGAVVEALKTESRSVGASRRTLLVGKLLVGAQMAFCLLLLVVAGLFVRSLRALASADIGFDRVHVLTASLDVRSLGYSTDQQQALYRRIVERVQAIPGVLSASLSENGPLAGSSHVSSLGVEGFDGDPNQPLRTNEEFVTPDYFATVGLRLLRGRMFTEADRAGGHATIVNQTFARRFFATTDPIGRRWGYGDDDMPFVIVGVVEDARYRDVRETTPNMAYHLVEGGEPVIAQDLEVRAAGDPAALADTLRRTLASAEPQLPVYGVATLGERVERSISQDAIVAELTSAFGGVALLLACLGLYGTISYGVSRRISELGLRLALGAARTHVLWLVLREALVLVLIGGLIGLPLTYGAARALRSLLYSVPPMDPLAYISGAALLVVVAAAAAYLPARRASRVEPLVALGRN